ncbi:MAG: hypothetical protein RBR08_04295 [Desulforegulaceae bacterium]|nr:hypothetical protein [Desulforegulaceae bacterium]
MLDSFREELENRGIDTTEKYYNSVILDEEQSEEIHQIVLERLKSDKRISALMDYFGKG